MDTEGTMRSSRPRLAFWSDGLNRTLGKLICFAIQALAIGWLVGSAQAVEPWATYRGNPQRTGHTDDQAGPAKPNILWAMPSKDHFIAAPMPVGERLFVSGLGPFNIANVFCLATEVKPPQRVAWTKSSPYLKLPTVSSPAFYKGKLVFGDGMHQTDGAILYCLEAARGFPLWQHPVLGKLVHLEGSPTVVDDKAYLGGGAAGVLCVDMDKITLEGKPVDPDQVQKILAQRWKELQNKYEEDKKKCPCFAIPPNEDQLPKANPARLWQQGKDKWHVDAAVNVMGDKVLVCSAFLDKEQIGDRSLFCLSRAKGDVLWGKPLKYNPWGGASVAGDTVIVTGSTIGYEPANLKKAKGFIAAYSLKDGTEIWSKDVPGGIVACAALADGAALVTATDGKVRSFDLADGNRRWIYEAKAPLFAPPAVAKGTVYAGDLQGVIHAIDLKTGNEQWKLDLGQAETKSPGMFYAGPIIHGGRLYAATCNLEGPFSRQGTVVVCIGDK